MQTWIETRRAAACGVVYSEETSDDREFLLELYGSTREAELEQTDWSNAQKSEFVRMQFDAQFKYYAQHYPDTLRLIIRQNDEALGRLYLDRWADEHRIVDIALLPRARGQGFGTAILNDLKEEADASEKPLTIHVEKNNPAMSLYRRLGFKTIEDKGVYDLMEWR